MSRNAIEPTRDEAVRLLKAGVAETQIKLLAGMTTPLYWYWPVEQGVEARNGSIFFTDCGVGCFGVTAAHVVEGYRRDKLAYPATRCQIGHDFDFDVEGRLLDFDLEIDIATFRITNEEVERLGKRVFTGSQKRWPPEPPGKRRGIVFAGFPGKERVFLSPRAISFGMCSLGGIATSVSDRDISSQIEREYLIDVLGLGLMPEQYDMRGMSGGPMLTLVDQAGLWSHRLAGVIYSGPSLETDENIVGFKLVRARRADFLLPDGRLDSSRAV